MFIKYQIPSDLLSYDGPEGSSVDSKVEKVKEYVRRMNAMVDESKQAQLQDAQQQQRMRIAVDDTMYEKRSASREIEYEEKTKSKKKSVSKDKKVMKRRGSIGAAVTPSSNSNNNNTKNIVQKEIQSQPTPQAQATQEVVQPEPQNEVKEQQGSHLISILTLFCKILP